MKKRIPKTIEPCPIRDSIVEIQFNTTIIHPEVIFGKVMDAFSNIFPGENIKSLPILELPKQLIEKRPELKFKPHYQFKDDTFVMQIGPQVFSIGVPNHYVGWTAFYKKIEECFSKFIELKIVESIKRLGIRYISFYEQNFIGIDNFDIFKHIDLEYSLPDIERTKKEMHIRTLLVNGQYSSNLRVLNNVAMNDQVGSIIDIDTSCTNSINVDLRGLLDAINNGHDEEKYIIFNLLKQEFIDKLNPKYED